MHTGADGYPQPLKTFDFTPLGVTLATGTCTAMELLKSGPSGGSQCDVLLAAVGGGGGGVASLGPEVFRQERAAGRP